MVVSGIIGNVNKFHSVGVGEVVGRNNVSSRDECEALYTVTI